MKRMVAVVLMFVALPLLASLRHSGRNLTINTEDSEPVTRCSQISVLLGGDRLPVIEEDVNEVRGLRSLTVRPSDEGGVYVVGTDDDSYSAKACKVAWHGSVQGVTTSVRGNELSSNIPDDVDAIVFFIVRAPRNASLELQSEKGPVSVYDFNGTLNAQTHNGPIELKNVAGTINADAINGPISFSGGSGTVKLDAQNGPISVKLSGQTWLNGTLDAHAHNGPLSLKLPGGYRSGVVVESNGGPVTCRAEQCREARRRAGEDDEWPRRIELGYGTPVVKLSAMNGPVVVKQRDE